MAIKTLMLSDLQDMLTKARESGDPKQLQQCEALFLGLLEQDPDNWPVLFYMAVLLIHVDRAQMSIPLLWRAADMMANVPEIWNNLGTAYRKCNIYKKSEECLLKARDLNPGDSDIWNNLGTLHVNEGTPAQGETYLREAIKLNPNNAQAYWNLGLCLLEQEKFDEGFKCYTYGLKSKDRSAKQYDNAVWWDGQPHPGKTIVVFGEQGIGDEIMFATCIPDLIERFEGKVIFDCHPRLVGMMKRSFPDIDIYPTRKDLKREKYAYWLDENPCHYRIGIGDLPKHFRRHGKFPKKAYLKPDPVRVAEYTRWLDEMGGGPYIGVSWVGGHKTTRKDLRCIRLDDWKPIFDAVGASVISCQYTDHNREAAERGILTFPEVFEATKWDHYEVIKDGEVLASAKAKPEAKGFAAHYGGEVVHKTGPGFDYDETAAFVQAIIDTGGVICSVNTSLVHLCGAMGVKCLTLTPSKPAWRYGMKRRDMVWYPADSVKQYRQKGEDWTCAIEQLAFDLKLHFQEKRKENVA